MSLWVLVEMALWLGGACITLVVVASWASGMGRWSHAYSKVQKGDSSHPNWQRSLITAVPAIVAISIVLMLALLAYSKHIEQKNELLIKAANDRAIASTNAQLLARAGVIDEAAARHQIDQYGPQPQLNTERKAQASIARDANTVQAVTELANQVLETKKAQEQALTDIQDSVAKTRIANFAATLLFVLLVSASMASFFATKALDKPTFSPTWLLFFVLFIAVGLGMSYLYGGVKIFKEPTTQPQGPQR